MRNVSFLDRFQKDASTWTQSELSIEVHGYTHNDRAGATSTEIKPDHGKELCVFKFSSSNEQTDERTAERIWIYYDQKLSALCNSETETAYLSG